MKKKRDPRVWLFSFSDLAFLLLIAFSQAQGTGKEIKIGEIDIPVVDKKTDILKPDSTEKRIYQIMVNKPQINREKPFQINISGFEKIIKGPNISKSELKEQLLKLKKQGVKRPLLVPDKYSLSKDTITGISLIQEIWNSTKKVVVQKSG